MSKTRKFAARSFEYILNDNHTIITTPGGFSRGQKARREDDRQKRS